MGAPEIGDIISLLNPPLTILSRFCSTVESKGDDDSRSSSLQGLSCGSRLGKTYD